MSQMPTLIKVADDSALQEQVWIIIDRPFRTSAGENTIQWARKPFRLVPGEPTLIPRPAADLWFGNPDLLDDPTDPSHRPRHEELKRVKNKWGIRLDESFEGRFPGVRMFLFDHTEVYPVMADPRAEHLRGPEADTISAEQLQRAVQEMARRTAELQALAKQQGLDLGEMNVSSAPPEVSLPTFEPPTPGGAPTPPPAAEAPTPIEDGPDASTLPSVPDPTANAPVAKKKPSKAKPTTPIPSGE